jgi:ISXO2-like transposase domain
MKAAIIVALVQTLRATNAFQHKADEYVRGDVHTNTVEGFFSIFKRGMKSVYQHCSEKHLHAMLRSLISDTTIASRSAARTSLGLIAR